MHIYANDMQIMKCQNIYKKYANVCENMDSICLNMHKYATKICRNMQQKYANYV